VQRLVLVWTQKCQTPLELEDSGVNGKRHSYLSATLEAFSMRVVEDKNGDTQCASLEDAMAVLESMVEPKRQAGSNGRGA
jgi:hypothetical protein